MPAGRPKSFRASPGVLREVRVDLGQVVQQGRRAGDRRFGAGRRGQGPVPHGSRRRRTGPGHLRPDGQADPGAGRSRQERARSPDRPEPGQGRPAGRRAEAPQPRLRRRRPCPDRQRRTTPKNLLEIVAPIDGTIIAWDATLGEAVEPTTQLFAHGRHPTDVALDRRLRERHRRGGLGPAGDLHDLGHRRPGLSRAR